MYSGESKYMNEPKFTISYGKSKKGNKTVIINQLPNDEFPYSQEKAFSANDKYKNVIKIRTIADAKYYEEYLEKTIEDVFEIAFLNQNWKLIPFNPIKTCITSTTPIPDDVYFNGDWND